ncbi:MAG: cytochrome d ubiquinol oxidase subunit II [Bermanella sp.]
MNNTILQLTRIVQQVALADSPATQVSLIVDSISDVIQADVCSLYRANEQQDMVLLASHGLKHKNVVTIPYAKGLVGLVAKSRHPVNVKDAAAHDHYYYLPQTQEEKFVSFCGVPLVLFGKVIGVLVVQSRVAELFSKESEGFLVALASQLALIVSNIPVDAKIEDQNDRHRGVKGAPGIGIGKVRLCLSGELSGVTTPLQKSVALQAAGWLDNYGRYPWMLIAPVMAFAGLALTAVLSMANRGALAFISSSFAVTGIICTAGFSLFPFLMPSSTAPSQSLTMWDVTSSQLTLHIMFWVAMIFVPIILSYTAWGYYKMWGRLTTDFIEDNQYSTY